MKKKILLNYFAIFSLGFILTLGCSKKDSDDNDTIIVKADKTQLVADEIDKVKLIAMKNNSNDAVRAIFKINGKIHLSSTFSTDSIGEYKIEASYNSMTSKPITIKATPVKLKEKYERKILLEDYTGDWCGHCARMMYYIKKEHEKYPNIVPVAIHNGDALQFSEAKQLMSYYRIDGFPSIIINKKKKTSGTIDFNYIKKELSKDGYVSIAIDNTRNDKNIKTSVKVKMGRDFDNYLGLIVMCVENKIIGKQRNYGSGQEGDPLKDLPEVIENYEHNHALRTVHTKLFGDEIPAEYKKELKIFKKDFSIVLDNSYVPENCEIVAIVVADKSCANVLNAQSISIDSSIDFHPIKK